MRRGFRVGFLGLSSSSSEEISEVSTSAGGDGLVFFPLLRSSSSLSSWPPPWAPPPGWACRRLLLLPRPLPSFGVVPEARLEPPSVPFEVFPRVVACVTGCPLFAVCHGGKLPSTLELMFSRSPFNNRFRSWYSGWLDGNFCGILDPLRGSTYPRLDPLAFSNASGSSSSGLLELFSL